MILSTYAGEAIHSRKNGSVFRFRPHGELHIHSGSVAAKHEAADVEKLGEGTLSARLFVGLSAPSPSGKQAPTYSVEDVVKAVVEIRKSQGQIPDSTFMAQKRCLHREQDRPARRRGLRPDHHHRHLGRLRARLHVGDPEDG